MRLGADEISRMIDVSAVKTEDAEQEVRNMARTALEHKSAAVFALVVLVAALVVQIRAHWARIAVRVGGSWIAASGLLMLGWSIRGA